METEKNDKPERHIYTKHENMPQRNRPGAVSRLTTRGGKRVVKVDTGVTLDVTKVTGASLVSN